MPPLDNFLSIAGCTSRSELQSGGESLFDHRRANILALSRYIQYGRPLVALWHYFALFNRPVRVLVCKSSRVDGEKHPIPHPMRRSFGIWRFLGFLHFKSSEFPMQE